MSLPKEIESGMMSGVPATLVTCSKDGVPNATRISQVFPVDDNHVALSFQFFNKTVRNVRENPHVEVELIDPPGMCVWILALEFVRSETEGDLFEQMSMHLDAMASMVGMADVFKLKASDVYQVKSCRKVPFV
jgi:flavin reductase (DIM6/NTAB) family NADH-FMN oxidoreductase RutF